MKQCSKCGEIKVHDLFAKRTKSPDGRSAWCKSCFADYDRERYQNGNDKARKRRNKVRIIEANRQRIWDYLLEHSCVDCGNTDPRVLEFDHRDDVMKVKDVCMMINLNWEKVLEEISKCDVRCANCHRIRTQLQFGTWRARMYETGEGR